MSKIVDNFDRVCNYLFDWRPVLNDDEFFFVRIIIRKKDGNDIKKRVWEESFKYYIIHSREDLLEKKEEIIKVCRLVNGRAYINLTRRNWREVKDVLLNHTYFNDIDSLSIGFNYVCAVTPLIEDLQYVVDIDDCDIDSTESKEIIDNISRDHYVLASFPSKTGVHAVIEGIDNKKQERLFRDSHQDVGLHRDGIVLLYYEGRD